MEAKKGHCVKLWGWRLDFFPDPKITKMTESWPTCQGERLTGVEPAQEKSVAVSKAERIWCSEEHFDIRHVDTRFEDWPAGHPSCLGPAFPHYALFPPFQNGNAYSVPYHTGSLGSAFLTLILHGVTVKRLPWVSTETWNSGLKRGRDCDRLWRLWKWPERILHYDIATSLWSHKVPCGGFNKNIHHTLKYLNAWSLRHGPSWEGLGVCPFWIRCGLIRKCVTEEGLWGFKKPIPSTETLAFRCLWIWM